MHENVHTKHGVFTAPDARASLLYIMSIQPTNKAVKRLINSQRERDRQRQRDRERETEKQRETKRETERNRQTEGEGGTDSGKIKRHRQTEE